MRGDFDCKVFLSSGLQCCKWETVDCLRRHQGLYLYLWIARFQFMSLCLLVDLTCSNTILLLCREKLPKKSSSDLNIYTQHQWSWQNIMRMISYDSREEHWLPRYEETDDAMNAQYCMIPGTCIRKDNYTYTATYGHRQDQSSKVKVWTEEKHDLQWLYTTRMHIMEIRILLYRRDQICIFGTCNSIAVSTWCLSDKGVGRVRVR